MYPIGPAPLRMRATSITVLSTAALSATLFQLAAAVCMPPNATTGLVFADPACVTGCLVSCPSSAIGVATIAICGADNQWVNLPVCIPQAPASISAGNSSTGAKPVNSTSTGGSASSGGVLLSAAAPQPVVGGGVGVVAAGGPVQQLAAAPASGSSAVKTPTNPAPRPPAPAPAASGGCNLPTAPALNSAACKRITASSGTCSISCTTGYTGTATTAQCLPNGSWANLPTCTLSTGGFSGWTRAVPTSTKLVGTPGCTGYKPSSVNWVAARDWLIAYFKQPGLVGPDQIPYTRVATLALRASFHDAGSRQGVRGGQDGSSVLAAPEQDWEANSFPFRFTPYVKAAVWPLVNVFGMSFADAIALAGFTGAQFIGAPSRATLSFGRCDSNIENPNVLPMFNLDYIAFAKYWASVGISMADAANLMGVHSAIDNEHGGPAVQWSSVMYQSQLKGTLKIVNITEPEGPKAVKWSEGPWKYTTNDALMSAQLIAQTCNPQPSKCPFKQQYLNLIASFAADVNKWNNQFSGAYDRMTRIGAQFGPATVNILIPQLSLAGPPPPPPPPPRK